MAAQNIETQRANLKFEHNGKLFVFDKKSADGTLKFWRCEAKNSKDVICKGRLHTDQNNVVIRELNVHTCSTDAARVEGII